MIAKRRTIASIWMATTFLAVNLMSSPGSGKTSLLEATIDAIGDRFRIAVIEGDLETENDAKRIRAKGAPAIQITTGHTCHLDAHMVHDALHALDLAATDIRVHRKCRQSGVSGQFRSRPACQCHASGRHRRRRQAREISGDRSAKSDLVLLSKTDLLDVLDDFSPDQAESHVRALANPAQVMRVSARRPDTLASWISWLEARLASCRERRDAAPRRRSTPNMFITAPRSDGDGRRPLGCESNGWNASAVCRCTAASA